MEKLYLTRKPSEIAMAFVQAECSVGTAYVAVAMWSIEPFASFVAIHFTVICAYLCWMFLFDMSGSRERREAAAANAMPELDLHFPSPPRC